MKKNINLIIDGIVPEKVMYDTNNHSLVVLYPAQEEFKKGDKARLNKDLNLKLGKWYNGLVYIKEIDNVKDAILTIDRVSESNGNIKAYNNIDGGWWWYSPEWLEHIVEDEVKFKRGDILTSNRNNNTILIFDKLDENCEDTFLSMYNVYNEDNAEWDKSCFRLATPEEQQILFDALKKEGKKWNAETLEIEDIVGEFKKGDILIGVDVVMGQDQTVICIFDKYNFPYRNKFYSLFNNIKKNNYGWISSSFRLATPSEIEQFDNDLKSIGKKWNAETLEIEDLDISDIVVDLKTAINYLDCPRYTYNIDKKDKRLNKFEAQITLQLIREAWNKFDGFVVDFNDKKQVKYSPRIYLDGSVACGMWWIDAHNIHSSCYSFPTQERAIQFGNQFKDLLKTAMGM